MAELPVVDGYSDLVQVARGGFGVVYRARQDRHDRVVALKVLSLVDLDDRARQRFDRECRAMGSLSWHPNVVALLDSGINADGHPWLAMEFLDAGSLADRLREGPIPWAEVLAVGVQVAGALDAAHAAGTLHRDLKPENLLVGPYGEVKLGDFGIAAVEGSTRTTVGHASFTVAHVAPEMLRGQRPDERSDLYGLASTLHTLVAGAPPFAGDDDEPFAVVMARVLQEPAPRLADVPDALADLLVRTLAKEPADRPQSAGDFGRALQQIQAAHGQTVTDLRLAPAAPVDPTGPQSGSRPGPTTGPPPAPIRAVAEPTDLVPPSSAPSPRGDPRPTVHHTPDPTGPTPATTGRTGGRRKVVVIAVAAAIVGVVVVASLVATSGGSDEPQLSATVAVGEGPEAVSATSDAVWVANRLDDTVSHIDPDTNEVTATIDVDDQPSGIAATDDAVWVANNIGNTVSHIDPANDRVVATIEVDVFPEQVAATDDAVWVTDGSESVTRIDPASDQVTDTINVATEPLGVAATEDAVWVASRVGGVVSRIDPATNEVVATIDLPLAEGIAVTGDAVWVVSSEPAGKRTQEAASSGTLSRIDPATSEVVATIAIGLPGGVGADDDVWVTSDSDAASKSAQDAARPGVASRIDLDGNQVDVTVEVGRAALGVSVIGDVVWVANAGDGTVSRID